MAASATVGILRVLLTANSAEFEAALKKAQGAAKAWSKDIGSIGRQATQLGTALTKTLTLPIVALGGGAVKAAMDFETAFANVGKTVDGVSDRTGTLTVKGEALAMTFRNMAKEIPATTAELSAIAALGGQMGVSIDNLAKFTKNVAALGVAVDGISAEDAAAGLAQIANVFGDKQVTNIDKMSSALVHLGNSSNATEANILEFTKRLSGAGNTVGMTIPEVMSLGTAMANVGINAEAGGTAMSTVIAKIGKAVSTGSQQLGEFAKVAGLSADAFAEVWRRSPIEAIDLFVKGLSSMKDRGVDLNLTMGELGTEGLRIADTLKRLAGAGDGVSTSLKTANEGFSAANKHLEEAEKKYATTANQIKLLWNAIKDVGITIGNALLPAIKSSVGLLNGLIPIIDNLAKGFAALPGSIQLVIVGLGVAVAAVGPLIFAFGQLAIAAAALTGAFTTQGLASRALAVSHEYLAAAHVRLSAVMAALSRVMVAALLPGFNVLRTATIAAATHLGLFTAAQHASTIASGIMAAAKRGLAAVLLTLQLNVSALAARFGIMTAAQNFATVASVALATALRGLAVAFSTVLVASGIGALLAGIGFGLVKITGAVRDANKAWNEGRLWDHLTARDTNNWVRRWIGLGDAAKQGTEAIEEGVMRARAAADQLRAMEDNLSGDAARKRIDELGVAVTNLNAAGRLTPDVYRRIAQEAKGIVDVPLPTWLQAIVDKYGSVSTSAAQAGASTKTFSAQIAAANAELQKMASESPAKMKELEAAIESGVFSMDELQKKSGLSELAFKLFAEQLQRTGTAQKAAASEASKHAKELEKQREALSKLGIVTETSVNEALAELTTLEKHATAGGAKHNVVLAAMLPLLRELHDKAVASGVGLDQTTAALRRAEAAAAALVDEMRALVPTLPLVVGLTDQVGRSVEIASLETANAAANARLLGQAYEHMGLKSRAELQKMAAASIDAFQRIVADGTATPEMIAAAFEKMTADVNAVTGQIPSFWDREVQPAILRAVDSISSGVADGFASMLAGAQSFAEGFKSIWESIKRAVINIFADILDSFINGLLKGILGALFGQKGAFAGGFGGLLRGALGLGGAALLGGGTAAAAGATTVAGVTLPPVTAGLAGTGLGGAAGATAGGGLLAGIAGGAGAGAAGFGLGQVGQRLFGGPGAAAGAFGAGSGFATGALMGSILPGIGTLVGGIIGGIGGLIGGLFGKGAGRSTVEDFAKQMGGFDELHRKLSALGDEGEQLWVQLTQGVGKNNKEQAVAAINAVIEALERHQQETEEAAKATEEAAVREVAAREAQAKEIQGQIDTLTSESQRLVDSIANEAPEEVMGVIEAQTRARIDQIETEKAALDQQLAEVVEAQRQALADLERESAAVHQRIVDRFKGGLTIPVDFDIEDIDTENEFTRRRREGREDWTAATGGIVTQAGVQYRALGGPAFPGRPKGMDRVPVWTTPGELILNEGQQGNIADSLDAAMRFVESAKADAMAFAGRQSLADFSRALQTVTIMEVDKRELGRVIADVLPNELRRLGVRVRS